MNAFSTVFLIINAVLILKLPRRWASLPLLAGACYMTLGQGFELGPFTFTVIRMLVAVGFVRVVLRREKLSKGLSRLDWLVLVWAVWALLSSVFHDDHSAALVFRLGLVYNVCGIYFLLRIFCQSLDDMVSLCRIIAILLIPVAIEMLYEKITIHNLFSALGGVSEIPPIREGRIRAQGPFTSSILAGTVGAACLPLVIGLWRQYRKTAILGILACFTMIVSSASSGPILSSFAAFGALLMWPYRKRMQIVRWLAIFGYMGLALVMNAPAYYIIWRLSPIGASTGWHRARLIDSAFQHLNEWWLAGTDYTLHWMSTGVSWSPDHTDITNYYIKMGVIGGLPLMIIFILVLSTGFSFVGKTLHNVDELPPYTKFMIWTFGASLFTHAVSFISVSYSDQSFIFLYFTLAAITSIWSFLAND